MKKTFFALALAFSVNANADCPIFISMEAPDGTISQSLSFFGRPITMRWSACGPGSLINCDMGHSVTLTPYNPVGGPDEVGILSDVTITQNGKKPKTERMIIGRKPVEILIGTNKTPKPVTYDHIPAVPTINDMLKPPAEQDYSGEGILRIEIQHACF